MPYAPCASGRESRRLPSAFYQYEGGNLDWDTFFLHQTGAVYALQASTSLASKPAGQWNTFEIEATSATIKVTLNGQLVTNYSIPGNTSRLSEGHIGLQCHTGNVQFRNVIIRNL